MESFRIQYAHEEDDELKMEVQLAFVLVLKNPNDATQRTLTLQVDGKVLARISFQREISRVAYCAYRFETQQVVQAAVDKESKTFDMSAAVNAVSGLTLDFSFGRVTIVCEERQRTDFTRGRAAQIDPRDLFGPAVEVVQKLLQVTDKDVLTVKEHLLLKNAKVVGAPKVKKGLRKKDACPVLNVYRSSADIPDSKWPCVYTQRDFPTVEREGKDAGMGSADVRLDMVALCNGDRFRPLRFTFRQEEGDLIGSFQASVEQLVTGNTTVFPLINEERKAKCARKGKPYTNSGRLQLDSIAIDTKEVMEENPLHKSLTKQLYEAQEKQRKQPYPAIYNPFTFLSYLREGHLDLELTLAIDMTGSNGHPLDIDFSLHALKEQGDNPYQAAMKAVGAIVTPYSHHQQIRAWGFGANVNGVVSHCFNINLNGSDTCDGIEGVLEEYSTAIQVFQFAGPTHFHEVINRTRELATAPMNHAYHVLLILTDGVLDDLQESIDAVVACSFVPLSIIIIGIGDNADWSKMDRLDADTKRLVNSDGEPAGRDLVQFVPFSEYKDDPQGLAAAVLEEIPDQVTTYYSMVHTTPRDLAAAKQDQAPPM